MRCARAVRKVGHSPPPVGSFLGVGLPQGTIAIVCPCSINPPPSCVYVPLQTGTLRPVYGDTFSGCLLRGIIFCSHFSDPLLHSRVDNSENTTRLNFGLLNCSCMLLEVAGFQGCYRGKHRNNWRCARAVRKRPPGTPPYPVSCRTLQFFATSAIHVDHIDTYPAGDAVNFQRSGGSIVPAKIVLARILPHN